MKPTALRWAMGLALLALIATALALRDRFDVAALGTWVQDAGAAGPIVFIAVYAAATVLCLPGALVTLAGGALFGPAWGTLWNLAGATLGSALAFLIARYLGANWVSRSAGPRLQRLNDGVADEGWRFIAFVRLVPLFPFNLLNFALGLTRVRFATYVAASAVFMLPGALAYTWLGHAGRQAVGGDAGMAHDGLIALALVSAMTFLPRWLSRLKAEPIAEVDTQKQHLERGAAVPVEFNGPEGHITGDGRCSHDRLATPAVDHRYRRALWVALVLNVLMFVVELGASWASGSVSLLADSIDFFGDAGNYAISLAVLGMAMGARTKAALFKAACMGAFGVFVLAKAAWSLQVGVPPEPATMGAVGFAALAVNAGVALMLYRFRAGDANMRSVWICSRNDALGNVAVMLAALGVLGTGSAWPDVLVAAVMGVLALTGSWVVVQQARTELRAAVTRG